jgi:uncharacterized membrane protein
MNNVLKAGRLLFAFSIIGMATQQIFYPEFRAIFVPRTPLWLPLPVICVYAFSLYLIMSCMAILLGKPRAVAILLGFVFILLFLTGHVPYRLSQELNNLGVWTVAIKCLAFGGGAFIASGSMKPGHPDFERFFNPIKDKLILLGVTLFSLMLMAFGIDHFLYTTGVSRMIPEWIPAGKFWTYFSGVALISSGTAILLRIKPGLAAILAGAMIFLWVVILHFPDAIRTPDMGNSNALTATFHALGFSGIAFMIAGLLVQKPEILRYGKE